VLIIWLLSLLAIDSYMINQRVFKRFHIYIVGEFTSVSRPAKSFLGITRDFSCGGFSFESQAFDLEPGDVLEFRLKHFGANLEVSSLGEIVWKRGTDTFSCLLGLKFREIADSAESLMFKLISAAGNIPSHALLSSMDAGDLNNGESPAQEDGAINVLADSSGRGAETGDGLHYCGQLKLQVRHKRAGPYIAIVLSVTIALFFTLAVPIEDNITGMHKTENIFLKNLPREEMYGKDLLSAVAGNNQDGWTMLEYTGSGQSQAFFKVTGSVTEDKAVKAEQAMTGTHESESREYFIQVGSWKNPDYAEEVHKKIMKYYPDAYMVMRNNFYVLRIPGVITKTQGNIIAEEIQARFKFSSLVVMKSK
jgi:hypothetical protein